MSLWKEFRDSLSSVVAFPADYFAGWFGVAPAESGVEVNELTAMQVAAFVGCVRVISGAIATLPLRVWETLPNGTQKIAPDHILDDVLNNQPNPEVSAADLIGTGMIQILLTGNCYMEKFYNGAGQPAALYLRNPFRTFPYRDNDGTLIYKTSDTDKGYERIIKAADIVHVKGLGVDSLVGLSPVKYYAREVLGNDIAAQSFGSKFFANDSRPGGYLKVPNFLNKDKKAQAVSSWMNAHGRGQSHRMALLEGGMTWEKVGVNPNEAQFIETRQFNREQIAAIFGVPVHFLGESVESRADMEQRGIEFLTFTIKPWLAKWEQAINMKMFPKMGRHANRFRAGFDTTMYERATYSNLLKGVQMGRYAGLYTMDEGRRLLGEQPYTKDQLNSDNPGDKVMVPVNMVFLTEDLIESGGPAGGGSGAGAGQGGGDQDGGDGGGKPPRQTGQGGSRDAEIKRYFLVFSKMFDDAFGRIVSRKNTRRQDFHLIFEPVLTTIAASFAFRADAPPGDMALPVELASFVKELAGSLFKQAAHWTEQNRAEACGKELRRVLELTRTKCLEIPVPEETEEEPEEPRRKVVKTGRAKKESDGTVSFTIEEEVTTAERIQ